MTRGLSDEEIKQSKSKRIMEVIAKKGAYFRENPNRFVSEYLLLGSNIKLKPFQEMILYNMFHSNYSMYIAARGQISSFKCENLLKIYFLSL